MRQLKGVGRGVVFTGWHRVCLEKTGQRVWSYVREVGSQLQDSVADFDDGLVQLQGGLLKSVVVVVEVETAFRDDGCHA